MRNIKLGADVDLDRIAVLTPGTSGADLSALVNEAAIRTVRRQGDSVEQSDFEDALKSFYNSRGVSLSHFGEVVTAGLPSWMRRLTDSTAALAS